MSWDPILSGCGTCDIRHGHGADYSGYSHYFSFTSPFLLTKSQLFAINPPLIPIEPLVGYPSPAIIAERCWTWCSKTPKLHISQSLELWKSPWNNHQLSMLFHGLYMTIPIHISFTHFSCCQIPRKPWFHHQIPRNSWLHQKKSQEFPGLDFLWFHRKHHGKHHQNPWLHSVFHGSALPSSRGSRCPPLPPCWPPPSAPTGPGRRWNTPRRATDGAHPKWKTWRANYGPLKSCRENNYHLVMTNIAMENYHF